MKKQNYISQSIIHFKQWTNNACAVLISLKYVVNISVLDCRITELLGDKKKKMIDSIESAFTLNRHQESEDEIDVLEPLLMPVIQLVEPAGNMYKYY